MATKLPFFSKNGLPLPAMNAYNLSDIHKASDARNQRRRLPSWFRVQLSTKGRFNHVKRQISNHNLNTICQSAACPNRNECWSSGTATFLILGDLCMRGCRFCNVPTGMPSGIDHDEPNRIADAVSALKLNYAVITSVTRDDLLDGGASMFAHTIRTIRERSHDCRVEVLIPDFQGSERSLSTVLAAFPDVLNHNIETVPRLYQSVRPQADYDRSLNLLQRAKRQGAKTKSGLMLGLGEGIDEVLTVMGDLREIGCDVLTLGQYLQPRKDLFPVSKYYHPDEFADFRRKALSMGFRRVIAGPLVRSSYYANSD